MKVTKVKVRDDVAEAHASHGPRTTASWVTMRGTTQRGLLLTVIVLIRASLGTGALEGEGRPRTPAAQEGGALALAASVGREEVAGGAVTAVVGMKASAEAEALAAALPASVGEEEVAGGAVAAASAAVALGVKAPTSSSATSSALASASSSASAAGVKKQLRVGLVAEAASDGAAHRSAGEDEPATIAQGSTLLAGE